MEDLVSGIGPRTKDQAKLLASGGGRTHPTRRRRRRQPWRASRLPGRLSTKVSVRVPRARRCRAAARPCILPSCARLDLRQNVRARRPNFFGRRRMARGRALRGGWARLMHVRGVARVLTCGLFALQSEVRARAGTGALPADADHASQRARGREGEGVITQRELRKEREREREREREKERERKRKREKREREREREREKRES